MNELLRNIPKVDELLRSPALAEQVARYGEHAVKEAIRAELEELRGEILSGRTAFASRLSSLPYTVRSCAPDIRNRSGAL